MAPQSGLRPELQRPLSDSLVRSQLENVLASELFSRSERLSAFLRFVVEETLNGHGETLKEPVLAHQLYGKEADFDGATNPVVRVDARRLRDKLREYYADRTGDPVLISLPKGSYVPAFELIAAAISRRRRREGTARLRILETAPGKRCPDVGPMASVRRAWRGDCVWNGGIARRRLRSALPEMARPTAPTGRIMLAVLPFQNLTGDPEQEYLCDGLTEEMIAILGGVDSTRLGIIARTSAMHYKNTTKRADEIGRELGVSYLLETSLRRVGDRARVTAQLIEVETQGHVWVEQYERDAEDVLALQREVAATVAQRTVASLGVPLRDLHSRTDRQSDNSLAYEHYLRGRYHWAKDTIDGLHKAQDHFQKAIALDPSYARAYSGLADTYALLGSYDIMPIGESHPLGRDAALKALELDDSLGEAHRSLAAIIGDYYWDWGEVERHYRRAIALDPNDVTTLRFYSFYLAYTGRPVEAMPIAEQARRLDPVSPSARMNLGVVLTWLGSRRRRTGVRGDFGSGSEFQLCARHARARVRAQRDARARGRGSAEGARAERHPSRRHRAPWLHLGTGWAEARGAGDARRSPASCEPANAFALPDGTRLRRPRGHGPRLRMAREGHSGALVGIARVEDERGFRWPPFGSPVSCIARPPRAAPLSGRSSLRSRLQRATSIKLGAQRAGRHLVCNLAGCCAATDAELEPSTLAQPTRRELLKRMWLDLAFAQGWMRIDTSTTEPIRHAPTDAYHP